MNDLSDFIEKAKIEIQKFDNHNIDSVYSVARSLWCCYSKVDSSTNLSLSESLDLILYCLDTPVNSSGSSLVRKIDISLAQLPIHLASVVKNANDERFQDIVEYVNACRSKLSSPEVITIVKKLFLMLIFQVLRNIPGSDIRSLINKCIVLDHLEYDITRGSKIDITLRRLNEKITLQLKRGKQMSDIKYISDILLLAGKLNYRLNNYTEAIRFLSVYAEQLEKQNKENVIDDFINKLAKIYIFIGYCCEKNVAKDQSQSLKSLNAAIDIFEDILNSRKNIQFNDCAVDIQIEIFHGLAHFYNERAVFHAPSITIEQRYKDIIHAQKNISIAKERDNNDAFHSCHGLICYENRDYERAATIYAGAKKLPTITNNKELLSEIEFYQAQTMFALGNSVAAKELLDKVESYFDSINNYDAIVHVRILRAKSQLAELGLFVDSPKNSNFFHELLDSLLEKGLSMYTPVSVEKEWRKIVLALNIFYYICKIREYSISFEAGVEEILYNLRKYSSANKSLEERQRIKIHKDCVKNFRDEQCEDDTIFLLDVNNVQLVCFGKDFSKDIYKAENNFGVGYKKKVKTEFESNILEQIKSNQRPDLILLNPSVRLITDTNRKQFLRDIINTGVCIVALGEYGESIARDCAMGPAINRIYQANNESELIQMGYLFRVYEMLRCDLTIPTPLLGLAPLNYSKSFSFQTCQKIEDLFIPNQDNLEKDISQFAQIIKALESIQIGIYNNIRKPIEFNDRFNQVISCAIPDITFFAFFPLPQDENDLNFSVPYAIFNKDFFTSYKYALSTIEPKKIVSHKPFTPYYANYRKLDEEIRRRANSFCKRKFCGKMTCYGGLVLLSEQGESIKDTIHDLLNEIFPTTRSFPNYYCLCCTVNDNDMSGIYVVMIKNDLKRSELEQKAMSICKTIHGVMAVQKQINSKDACDRNILKQHTSHEAITRTMEYEAARIAETQGIGNSITTTMNSNFKIGVSFCGEDRSNTVEPVLKELLLHNYIKNDIFYDEWHSHLISTPGQADVEAKMIYENKCDFIVVFLSKNYSEKPWTGGIEWEAIRRIINTKANAHKICLLNIDGVDINKIDGLSSLTSVAKQIKEVSASDIVNFVLRCVNKRNK
ncbi:MAG: hypothetical protein FWC26_13600 [Fibromonadales bacterium]|nr:hypothetical protein [Fibromonadales bacterium]